MQIWNKNRKENQLGRSKGIEEEVLRRFEEEKRKKRKKSVGDGRFLRRARVARDGLEEGTICIL